MPPIRRWLANPASKLLALRLSTIYWVNGDEELLPPPLLSIELSDERGHVVFFTKIDAARLSIQLSAVVKMRMTLRAIVELLASNCSGPVLAIASDEDRKSRANKRLLHICERDDFRRRSTTLHRLASRQHRLSKICAKNVQILTSRIFVSRVNSPISILYVYKHNNFL